MQRSNVFLANFQKSDYRPRSDWMKKTICRVRLVAAGPFNWEAAKIRLKECGCLGNSDFSECATIIELFLQSGGSKVVRGAIGLLADAPDGALVPNHSSSGYNDVS